MIILFMFGEEIPAFTFDEHPLNVPLYLFGECRTNSHMFQQTVTGVFCIYFVFIYFIAFITHPPPKGSGKVTAINHSI